MTAPNAGIIHSDFERGFIRAEASYQDLEQLVVKKLLKRQVKCVLKEKIYYARWDICHFASMYNII